MMQSRVRRHCSARNTATRLGAVHGAPRRQAQYSVLRGGTYVNYGRYRPVRIVSAVSSGVRRIEALTGEAARNWLVARDEAVRTIAGTLKTSPDEAPARVVALVEERKRLEKELAEAKRALALGGGSSGDAGPADEDIGGVTFTGQVVEGLNPKELRPLLDEAKNRIRQGSRHSACQRRKGLCIGVTDDLVERFRAVDLVRVVSEALGGKGGGGAGQPQGGAGGAADEALAAVRSKLSAG